MANFHNAQINTRMAETAPLQTSHVDAIEGAISKLRSVSNQARRLMEDISGDHSPGCEKAPEDCPPSSLLSCLNSSPVEIRDLANSIENSINAIREALRV